MGSDFQGVNAGRPPIPATPILPVSQPRSSGVGVIVVAFIILATLAVGVIAFSVTATRIPRPQLPTPSPTTPWTGSSPRPTPVATRSMEGEWGGSVTETTRTGRSATYPVKLVLDSQGNGRYLGRYSAEAMVWNGGIATSIRVEEDFEGEEVNGRLVLHGQTKVRRHVNTGMVEVLTPDRCDFSLRGGLLVGLGGNDLDGYVDFSLSRR